MLIFGRSKQTRQVHQVQLVHMPPSTTRSFVSSSSCGGVRFNQGVVDPCRYGDSVEQLEPVAERLRRVVPEDVPGALPRILRVFAATLV